MGEFRIGEGNGIEGGNDPGNLAEVAENATSPFPCPPAASGVFFRKQIPGKKFLAPWNGKAMLTPHAKRPRKSPTPPKSCG
jgi:hypothetical protein